MHFIRRVTQSKPLTLFLAALIILAIAGGLYFFVIRDDSSQTNSQLTGDSTPRPSNTVDYGPSEKGDNDANEERKSNPDNAAPTLNYGSTTPSSPGGTSITVTRAGRVGGDLQVGTLISGVSSGTCTLTISQTGQANIERTAAVIQEGNSYACPVFGIPLGQFPNHGKWNVSVKLTQNNTTATANWDANPVDLSQ
jgi:hypothetical protein